MRRLHRTGKLPGFINTLQSIANSESDAELGEVAKGLLAAEYYLDGQFENALVTAQENKTEAAGTKLEALALLVLFDTHFYGLKDRNSAVAILTELTAKYAD